MESSAQDHLGKLVEQNSANIEDYSWQEKLTVVIPTHPMIPWLGYNMPIG